MQLAGKYVRSFRSSARRDGPFGFRAYTIIYAIDAPDIGRIKFGKTIDIKRRFAGIASISPAPVVLLGQVWLPDEAEVEIFKFLQADRCHGEWFYRTDPVRSIAALIAAKRIEQLAEVLGMERMLAEHRATNVSWGVNGLSER